MKMKKILATLLAVVMVLGTTGVSFANEDLFFEIEEVEAEELFEEEVELFGEVTEAAADEIPTATYTKIEDSGSNFAVKFDAEASETYKDWYVDVELMSNMNLKLDARSEIESDGYVSVTHPNTVIGHRDLPKGSVWGTMNVESIELEAGKPFKTMTYYIQDLGLGNPNQKYKDIYGEYADMVWGVTIDSDFIEEYPDLEMEVALKIYNPTTGSNESYTLASYTYKAAVAKVGDTKYATIEEALDAWTNNTKLTLLSDVTLPDVVALKSTEHHILNLGTYTLTAASGKNAFEITACGTGAAERDCITINADAENPGGINAGKKAIVYYNYSKGTATGDDRPIIKINGGVFNASTNVLIWGSNVAGIHTIGSAARKCATVNVAGGTFNCSILGSGKSKLIISGGTFNYSVSSTGDTTALRLIYGGKFKNIGFMTSGANDAGYHKLTFGTSEGEFNKGVYVDEEGYIVVGGPVITEADDRFAAHNSNYSKWSSYLEYSSAKTSGIYYTSAETVLNKITSGTISLFKDTDVAATASGALTLDLAEGVTYSGNVTLKTSTSSLTVNFAEDAEFTGKVTQYDSTYYLVKTVDEENGTVTYTQTNKPADKGEASVTSNGINTVYDKFTDALAAAEGGDTITLHRDVTYNIGEAGDFVVLAADETVIIDLNGKTLSPEDPEIPTFVNDEKYILKNGTINGDVVNNGGSIKLEDVTIKGNYINNSGTTVMTSGTVEGNFTVIAGEADILEGTVEGAIESAMTDKLDVTGGTFLDDPTEFVVEGYEVIRYAGKYIVVEEGKGDALKEANAISVVFKKTDIKDGKDTVEGKDVYSIVLKANEGDKINELASADLTFVFNPTPLDEDGEMSYFITPANGVTLSQTGKKGEEHRYMFNYDGVTKDEETGTEITIGTLEIEGYGQYSVSVYDFKAIGEKDTNIVNATTVNDNLVDYFIAGGENDDSALTGGLIINTDIDDTYKGNASGTVAVPVRTLTINVTFPNNIKENVAAYQNMTVKIAGGNVDKTVKLGSDWADLEENTIYPANVTLSSDATDASYVVTVDLPFNTAYMVTVEGDGYRTARYTVKLTDDKILNFWNNVMDGDNMIEVEEDAEATATTKTFLAGDIVKDNQINVYDLSAVVSYFGKGVTVEEAPNYAKYDLDRNGVIDARDVAYVLVSWGE